jgi:hypothetical protein
VSGCNTVGVCVKVEGEYLLRGGGREVANFDVKKPEPLKKCYQSLFLSL